MKRVILILAIMGAMTAMTAFIAGADPIHVGGSNFTLTSSPSSVGGAGDLSDLPGHVYGRVNSHSPLFRGATVECSPIHVGGS